MPLSVWCSQKHLSSRRENNFLYSIIMPFKRKSKRHFRKRTTRKSSKRIVKTVKRVLSRTIETKYHDQNPALFAVANSGSMFDFLNFNAQGTSDFQERIGDKIQLSRFSMRCVIDASNTDEYNFFRVIIFRWRVDDNILVPTTLDILQTSDVYSPYSFDLKTSRKRQILFDRTYLVVSGQSNAAKALNINFSLRGHKVNFIGATDNGEGKVYALFISDSTAVNHPSIYLFSRITYKDA